MRQEIPPIMTFAQCQNILHIGKNKLLEMLHDGTIEGFKVGNQWRISREELKEYIEHACRERFL